MAERNTEGGADPWAGGLSILSIWTGLSSQNSKEGNFREAQQMDKDDLRNKFGDKYDEGIQQMEDHTDKLDDAGELGGVDNGIPN